MEYPALIELIERYNQQPRIFPPSEDWAHLRIDAAKDIWPLMLDDLAKMPGKSLIVEGAWLHPSILTQYTNPKNVIFLIADIEFQQRHYLERKHIKDWFEIYENPDGAFEKLMAAHEIMANDLSSEAMRCGVLSIAIDESTDFGEVEQTIVDHFGL